MDENGVKKAGVQYSILYDLLKTLVLKKPIAKGELLCTKKYKRFLNDYSYTTMVCKTLHEYLDRSKFTNKSFED